MTVFVLADAVTVFDISLMKSRTEYNKNQKTLNIRKIYLPFGLKPTMIYLWDLIKKEAKCEIN